MMGACPLLLLLLLLAAARKATAAPTDQDLEKVDLDEDNNSSHQNWPLINEKQFGGRVWVRRYRSRRTNLTVRRRTGTFYLVYY